MKSNLNVILSIRKNLRLKMLVAFTFLTLQVNAQVGAVAPDFTAIDINGNTHNLYSYLNDNKVVVLFVFATFNGGSWDFHNNKQYLQNLYPEFGPDGSDEVVFLAYEVANSTTIDDMNGTGTNTQGDWVSGTPFPMMNEPICQLEPENYYSEGFPTINLICPSDKTIAYDLWYSLTADFNQSLDNMRTKIQEIIDNCVEPAGLDELKTIEAEVFPNPTQDKTSIHLKGAISEPLTLEIYSMSGVLLYSTVYSIKTQVQEIELDLSILQSGTYLVRLNTSSGSKELKIVKKIIE